MEENTKKQQDNLTPPPVPQPPTPPTFQESEEKEIEKERQENGDRTAQENGDRTNVTGENMPENENGQTSTPPNLDELLKRADQELKAFEAEPLPNVGIFSRVFSFKGRITRMEFLLTHALILLHFSLVGYVANVSMQIASFSIGNEAAGSLYNRLMFFSGLFIFMWFYTAQGVKRCHDVGWCGWYFYIPFINIPLLFKKPQKKTNRYGRPAALRNTCTEEVSSARETRKRGIICAAAWLFFSPVYLFLTCHWRIQKVMARVIMFMVSPLVISVGYGFSVAHQQSLAENTREAKVMKYLSKENTGMALPLKEVDWQGRDRLTGLETYRVDLEDKLSKKQLQSLETLAKKENSGWTAYANEEEADNADDYGYYLEDYGQSLPQSAPTKPTYFQFTKDISDSKSKKKQRIVLTIQKDDKDGVLTIQGL